MRKTHKLTSNERDSIAILYAQKISISKIAKQLRRSKSTISDEIRRNRRWDRNIKEWTYEAIRVQLTMFEDVPSKARKSTTLDNGKEHFKHMKLKDKLDMDTYFCHPYCSGERGTNENTNGLIRRYFPKGTDFTKVTDEDVELVLYELNTRPRKCLGFQTPLEVFRSYIENRSDLK
ncbi:IS30 family transposase [Candidatus Woesebacteria bacterium]|nr:IS30 family transposase [Candidatus Woesebacteria bacterium]